MLFAGRLILAHNRVLYPGRKWFMRALASAPEKPEGILELARALVAAPGAGRAQAFLDSLTTFPGVGGACGGGWNRFRRDSGYHWFNGRGPLEDC